MDDSVRATHTVRIAAVADIHCGRSSHGELRAVFGAMGDAADIVLLGGDLTNYGVVEEAKVLVEELAPLKNKPVFAVLGNHDVESNQQGELVNIFRDAGVTMLD